MKKILVFVFVLIPVLLQAQQVDWTGAQWIWQTEDGPSNSWVSFRKTLQLENLPESALAKISADSKFWLWINGNLVVFEGGAARGPSQAGDWDRVNKITPANSWYESVELRPFLKEGENIIAILVWYWGRETHKGTHVDSKKGGFLFHCELGDKTIHSDSSWKIKLHPGYDNTIEPASTSLVQFPVKFDANTNLNDWSENSWITQNFSDDEWENAVEKGMAGSSPWYDLIENYVPQLINHGLKDYANNESFSFPFISDGTTIECKLPFNQQITPYFEIEADSGKIITITTDNRLNKITATYTTKKGPQAFECLSWMNGHTIKYDIPAGIKVKALKHRWMSVGEMAGRFEASDAFYQRLWWMGRNTLFVCARDNFMDCPDRERALWIGDVADQTGYLFYAMDNAGRQLLKKAILTTINFSENKVLGALGPLRVRELPAQSLQFIAQTVWPYYFNTGDKATLELAYPFVYDYLALFPMQSNGLPAYRKGKSRDSWDWVDWGIEETIDKATIQPTLYYMALVEARKMAEVLEKIDDIDWFDTRINSIQQNFNKTFWKNGFYSSNASKFKDDRANALAILSGLADSTQSAQVVKNVLIPNRFCSPHFEWMVEDAMCVAGFHKEALARMKARYQSQVDKEGMSTLYENFPNGGSYNHAWNAPNTILSKHIAGIVPTKTGWEEFQVLPNLAHFTSLKHEVPAVHGEITVEINVIDKKVKINLSSPDGTKAIVGIPKEKFSIDSVLLGGATIWKDGKFLEGQAGVSFLGEDENYLKFGVEPGNRAFLAERSAPVVLQRPFLGEPFKIPGIIEAEYFDLGGMGLSFHDSDKTNESGLFRTEPVDIGAHPEDGFVVTGVYKGEWLEYTIDVQKEDFYQMTFDYSSMLSYGEIGAELPDEERILFKNLSLPQTSELNWDNYTTLSIDSIFLKKGVQTLRLTMDRRGYNLDKFSFSKYTPTFSSDMLAYQTNVFPNPSRNGVFNFYKPTLWDVYSLSGQKVISGKGKRADISRFLKGIYFLKTEESTCKILYQ